jgi:signal transduction histidine kinase
VLREGLSNVARHAGASSTRVEVAVAGSTVSVCIQDDGRGLGDRTLHGTGTASMRERAEMVSGTLSLTDRADGGAQLLWTASLPGGASDATPRADTGGRLPD